MGKRKLLPRGKRKLIFLGFGPRVSIQKVNKMGLGNIVFSQELVWCPEEADPKLASSLLSLSSRSIVSQGPCMDKTAAPSGMSQTVF